MLRASVLFAFEIPSRPGTYVVLKMEEGALRVGQTVSLKLADGPRSFEVRAVELALRRAPYVHENPAILIDGISPGDVPVGALVIGNLAGD